MCFFEGIEKVSLKNHILGGNHISGFLLFMPNKYLLEGIECEDWDRCLERGIA